MQGDRNDPAERQPANVRAVDPQCVHPGEDGLSIIVPARSVGRWIAVAIAGIVERDCPARPPEMGELGLPHRLVRSHAVKEDDRNPAAARFGRSDPPAGCSNARHGPGIVRPKRVCKPAKGAKLNGNTCDGSATANGGSARTAAIEVLEVCDA